jgi:hypothetical protein
MGKNRAWFKEFTFRSAFFGKSAAVSAPGAGIGLAAVKRGAASGGLFPGKERPFRWAVRIWVADKSSYS